MLEHEPNNDLYSSSDPLFIERFDVFMDRCLNDVQNFAERERKPYEQMRRYVAEWHCRWLFQQSPPGAGDSESSTGGATSKQCSGGTKSMLSLESLRNISDSLESLRQITAIESFLLAVHPTDPTDQGFLGGTIAGREFWRELRHGGEVGARNMKVYCVRKRNDMAESLNDGAAVTKDVDDTAWNFQGPPGDVQAHFHSDSARTIPGSKGYAHSNDAPEADASTSGGSKKAPALTLKAQVYANVRSALRSVSGIRTADMKWTNHDRLTSSYGVRLVGWPPGIPMQNPSHFTSAQNRMILDYLQSGRLRFVRLMDDTQQDPNMPGLTGQGSESASSHAPTLGAAGENSAPGRHDLLWINMYDDSADYLATSIQSSTAASGLTPPQPSPPDPIGYEDDQVGDDLLEGTIDTLLVEVDYPKSRAKKRRKEGSPDM